jgi:hypothetical protein
MKKSQIVIAIVLAMSMFGAGYAASSFVPTHSIYPSRVNVIVRYGIGPIRAYWFDNHTNLVTAIDFGNVLQGDNAYVYFYIFNENATYAALVDWSSNIYTVTSGKIADSFSPDIHGADLTAGNYIGVWYQISVAADTPVGPYTWTLNLGVQV